LVLGSPHTFNNQMRITMREAICIFAGPSLFDTGLRASTMNDIAWLPPVRRGDIEQLVAKHTCQVSLDWRTGHFTLIHR
jgi:hypothetical protein